MSKIKKAIVGGDKAHAVFSASGSKRWLGCPGSIELSKQAPPQEDSKWGIEGTQAHEVLEFLVKNRKHRSKAILFLRQKYPEAMIIHAEMALDYIEKRLRELEGSELVSEIRCDLPVSHPGQFGTVDVAIIEHFGRLVVIDYKYGAGIPVSAKRNSQLIYYALAIAARYDYNFSEIEIVVIQPRAQIDGEYVRSDVISVDEILEWREKFEKGIKAALKPDAPLVADNPKSADNYCRFCPAKIICPEIKNGALRAAQAAFDDVTGEVTLPEVRSKKTGAIYPTITPEYLARALPAVDKLETWIAAVREAATKRLEAGAKIPGYDLIPTRPSRKWTDAEKVARLARKKFGDKAFSNPDLLSPAQLEKLGPKAKIFTEKFSVSVSSGVKLGAISETTAFDDEGGTGYVNAKRLKSGKRAG